MTRERSRILVLLLALAALLAVTFTPALAEGKVRKRGKHATVKVKLPRKGNVSFVHVDLEVKKAKRGRRSAPRGKRVSFKVAIKNRGRLSRSVAVYGGVAGKKRRRSRYVADFAVINRSKPPAGSGRARSPRDDLAPGEEVVIRIRVPAGAVVILEEEEEDDTLEDDPDHEFCEELEDDYAAALLLHGVAIGVISPEQALNYAAFLACDDSFPQFNEFADFFSEGGCWAELVPFDAREFTYEMWCNRFSTAQGVQVADGRVIHAISPRARCGIQTLNSAADYKYCALNLPAFTRAKGKIRTLPTWRSGMIVKVFWYEGTERHGPYPSMPIR